MRTILAAFASLMAWALVAAPSEAAFRPFKNLREARQASSCSSSSSSCSSSATSSSATSTGQAPEPRASRPRLIVKYSTPIATGSSCPGGVCPPK